MGMPRAPLPDGTDRLCRAIYGREPRPADYIGGADAKMLHDAATKIDALERRVEVLRAERDALLAVKEAASKLYGAALSHDEVRLLLVGFAGTNMPNNLHERCDRIQDARNDVVIAMNAYERVKEGTE